MLVAELCWSPSIAIVEFECIIITELVDGGKITTLKYPIPLFKCLLKVFLGALNSLAINHAQSIFPYFDLGSFVLDVVVFILQGSTQVSDDSLQVGSIFFEELLSSSFVELVYRMRGVNVIKENILNCSIDHSSSICR
jgi:hypothetical protein